MKNQNTVFFDGKCQMCVSTKNILQTIDKNNQIDYVDLWKSKSAQRKGIKLNLLQNEVHLMTNEDQIHRGYYAFKKIASIIPSLFLLKLILAVPGFDWLGEKIYKIIAKVRQRDRTQG
jgi:predicted DCC family thiol-disulfide oxidoreductase YuxK